MKCKLPIQAKLQVFLKSYKIETSYQTLSRSAELCPAIPELASKFKKSVTETPSQTLFGPGGHCPAPPDFVRILNLSPTASFLREPYKYPSTSNSSSLLAIAFSC
jgi:hypothetical protein